MHHIGEWWDCEADEDKGSSQGRLLYMFISRIFVMYILSVIFYIYLDLLVLWLNFFLLSIKERLKPGGLSWRRKQKNVVFV